MTLEKNRIVASSDVPPETNLNLNSVSAEKHVVGKVVSCHPVDAFLDTSNDKAVQLAANQWDSIMTKFDKLPKAYQQLVLDSFADHMNGEHYPLYDRFKSTTV